MEGYVIALGFFDGVHLGHGQLLKRCRIVAEEMGLPACALTFDTHPDTLVTGKPVLLLNSPEDRESLMEDLYGIDRILTLHFDTTMRDMPWQDFFTEILLKQYRARHLVCGHDFCFGARGLGTGRGLQLLGVEYGVTCDVIPEYRIGGVTVSSTYLRGLIQAGEVEKAAEFYGHPHILTGDLLESGELLPPEGVLLPGLGTYRCQGVQHGESRTVEAVLGTGIRVRGTGLIPGRPLRLEFLNKE